jgi:hypothetical protein
MAAPSLVSVPGRSQICSAFAAGDAHHYTVWPPSTTTACFKGEANRLEIDILSRAFHESTAGFPRAQLLHIASRLQ